MECVKTETEVSSEEVVGTSNLQILKKYYKEAFKFINEGLNLEDKGKNSEAVLCYKKGLRSLEGAIKLPNGAVGLNEEEANSYKDTLAKLIKAQKEVYMRLDALGDSINVPVNKTKTTIPSAPPLEAASTKLDEPDNKPRSLEVKSKEKDLNGHLNDTWQDVKELLSIEDGVRLFHVDDKGDVSTWTSPCKLNVFQILKENLDKLSPAAFMKCGEWIYPMEPGQSPVLQTKHRTYMFPDVSIEQTNASSQMPCVGVVLADFVPDAVVSRFERILSCYCDFRKEIEGQIKEKPKRPPPPVHRASSTDDQSKPVSSSRSLVETDVIIAEPGIANMEIVPDRKWADKISSGINVGSQWISWGFLKGAQYTGALVEKGAASLRERLQPNEEATIVDPQISANIRQLHQATGSVVQVSAFLVSALGQLTVNLGKKLAPHVVQHGQQLLPAKYKFENNEKSQNNFDEARKVAIAGLQGFGMVFLALEQGGKDLYNTISAATVQTVSHKYGEDVGDVTHDTMGAAGNALQAYWNVSKLGPKAIAKRAVKDTGKAIIHDENIEKDEDKISRR